MNKEPPKYKMKKANLSQSDLDLSGMKSGPGDLNVATGDLAEKGLYRELKIVLQEQENCRLLGPQIKAARQKRWQSGV